MLKKKMFSEDGENRPLMTESELRDACLHDAATTLSRLCSAGEFEDCRLNDDGYKWPTSVSRIDLKHPESWTKEEAIADIRRSTRRAPWLSPSGTAAALNASTWTKARCATRPRSSTTLRPGRRSRRSPSSSRTTTRVTAVTASGDGLPRAGRRDSAALKLIKEMALPSYGKLETA